MASYNKIILVGNLTRDPQVKQLPNQTVLAEFGIAVNHKWRSKDGQDREEVLFIDCAAFGRAAEVIGQYCQKGKALLVEGRLKFDMWEDRNGGGKRSKHSVVVDSFQFIGSKGDNDNGDSAPPQSARPPARHSGGARKETSPPFGEEQQFSEDSIPF